MAEACAYLYQRVQMIRAMYDSSRCFGRFAQDDSCKNEDDSSTKLVVSEAYYCRLANES